MPAGTITALQAQLSDSQRVSVFIDDEFALGVSMATLARERLYVGQVLSADDYARLERAVQADRALSAALRALDARPRSTAELRLRLKRKGFDAESVDAALARLTDLGLLDDVTFARTWVENRQNGRPRGASALRDELRRKGVGAEIIAATLDDDELVGDADDQAERLARAALRRYAGAADFQIFARRLGGYLQRRGYTYATIRPIMAQLWRELGHTAADER
jgi:regulatory protein